MLSHSPAPSPLSLPSDDENDVTPPPLPPPTTVKPPPTAVDLSLSPPSPPIGRYTPPFPPFSPVLSSPPPPVTNISYPSTNNTTPPVTHETSPPGKVQSTSSSTTSIGAVIGISVGVTGAFFIVALFILFICYRNRVTHGKLHDHESPKAKDSSDYSYNDLRQSFKQKSSAEGSPITPKQVTPFHPIHGFDKNAYSSSLSLDAKNRFSPKVGGNFTYKELLSATGGFSTSNLLGEGGFGYVHKGVLPTGREVAVKQLKVGSHQGEREFQAEVETISRVHHKHLVSLVGYCMTGVKRLLVYEFVPNRTLEYHLHGKAQSFMKWASRVKIAVGSAKGLAYLHEDCYPTIIHRDIKASNILLDSNFEAKVADFGLAKFLSDASHHVSHVSTRVVGTIGYLAPEYALSGKASDKSDIFSFGVMLLELITGRPPIVSTESSACSSLVSWARPLLKRALEDGNFDTLVDPCLGKNYDHVEMSHMIACAAACVRHSYWSRPRMSQVVRALEGDASLLGVDDEETRPGQSTVCDFDSDRGHFFENLSKSSTALESLKKR